MADKKKERLDVLLVKRNLAESREKAKAYIMAGNVFVDGVREDKAGTNVAEGAEIELRGMAMKYVSRGGFKLEKAIAEFGVALNGAVCMDVGSSTGGFTDCMLQNGAVKVFAVDVGTNQLAWKLRNDERVVSMEQTNIRYVTPEDIGEQVDFVSIDVAFISLTKVLAPVYDLMKVGARIVCLIKPQFEAGREKVGKKGVVRERETHLEVIEQVIRFADSLGFHMLGLSFSPIRGPEGNIEYLLYMEKGKEERGMEGLLSDDEGESDEATEEIDAAFSVLPLSEEADALVRLSDKITKEAHASLE
ncbi:MAG: TlyA family RNA methyltransferase [Lachnospiraceae bacterium]|nr:TlyA family RNA methyltransferase [Lachnospiraceae bacterium]